jgi:cytochrome c-type biogenesis protein CcmE
MNAAAGQSSSPPPGSQTLSRKGAMKIVVSVVAVLAAVGTLFYVSAAPGMEYYKYVDEVMAKKDDFRGKRLKVHGYVVEGSIMKKKDALDYKFKLQTRAPRPPAVIDVEYRGLVPDNFKPGAEVVAKGALTPDNRLVVAPEGIDAKCPSKYEAGAPKLNPGASNTLSPGTPPTAKTAQN